MDLMSSTVVMLTKQELHPDRKLTLPSWEPLTVNSSSVRGGAHEPLGFYARLWPDLILCWQPQLPRAQDRRGFVRSRRSRFVWPLLDHWLLESFCPFSCNGSWASGYSHIQNSTFLVWNWIWMEYFVCACLLCVHGVEGRGQLLMVVLGMSTLFGGHGFSLTWNC